MIARVLAVLLASHHSAAAPSVEGFIQNSRHPIDAAPLDAKNVLLIIVDDLRPEIVAYGRKDVVTPHIDSFAKESMIFSNTYCQQALCAPTRNSFLSGRRPQRTQAWNLREHFREVGPGWVSLPGYFKNNGYLTLGTGKTFHPGLPRAFDDQKSWSDDRPYMFAGKPCGTGFGCPSVQVDPENNMTWEQLAYPDCVEWPGSLACPNDRPDEDHADYRDMMETISNLQYHQKMSLQEKEEGKLPRPFFFAFGVHRPHLPWNVPRRFWDLYTTEDIALPEHQKAPDDMPPIAFTYECDGGSELNALGVRVNTPWLDSETSPPDNVTRSLRRGYYSAVSFADHIIGQVLAEVDKLGYKDNTVVAILGDHGWNLGEQNVWGKHNNFELGTRVPFIVRAPWLGKPGRSHSLVESVDLYPTLASLAGLSPPEDVDGDDVSKLFTDPRKVVKKAAFSEYPRCPQDVNKPWTDNLACSSTTKEYFTVMGYSVRTADWRYTVWLWWDRVNLQGDFTKDPVGVELYSHEGDSGSNFDKFENENLAKDPLHKKTVDELHKLAVDHWDKVGNQTVRTFSIPSFWFFEGVQPNYGPPLEAPHLLPKWDIKPLSHGIPECAWDKHDNECPEFEVDNFMVGMMGAQHCPHGSVPITNRLDCEKFARAAGFAWSIGWELQNGQQCHWCAGCKPMTVRLHHDHRAKSKFVCKRTAAVPSVHGYQASSRKAKAPVVKNEMMILPSVSLLTTGTELNEANDTGGDKLYDPAVDAGLNQKLSKISLLHLDTELDSNVPARKACASSPLCGLLGSGMRDLCSRIDCID